MVDGLGVLWKLTSNPGRCSLFTRVGEAKNFSLQINVHSSLLVDMLIKTNCQFH